MRVQWRIWFIRAVLTHPLLHTGCTILKPDHDRNHGTTKTRCPTESEPVRGSDKSAPLSFTSYKRVYQTDTTVRLVVSTTADKLAEAN